MDALYENIRLYCTILGKCGQSEVENWQAEDLDRAFHWADYFKKVASTNYLHVVFGGYWVPVLCA